MDKAKELLELSKEELAERKKVRKDYYYFLGKCKDKDKALNDEALLGQSWVVSDNLDYIPTQDIRNKVKSLLKKQARFMFGKAPNILFKPYKKEDKESCEELRQFIDDILEENNFFSETLKAFLMCSVEKRVLLRLEANPKQPINLCYHKIKDFSYKKEGRNLKSFTIVIQDKNTLGKENKDKIYYRYTYYMPETNDINKKENGENKKTSCHLKIETFEGDRFDKNKSSKVVVRDTLLSKIPGFVIVNGGLLGNKFGESDLEDLKDAQNLYNKRISDFGDALRFQMFGQTVIIDATEGTVNNAKIAPNGLLPLQSIDEEGKKADAKILESSFSSAEPIEMYLKRAEHDMREALDMPEESNLKDIPSAKALKYMYNDLIARCEEKWNDWDNPIKQLIRLIIESCSKFECYPGWDKKWDNLKFRIVLKHNYPLPQDEEDKKRLAIEEVNSNVRSHRSYIKDYSNEEDVDGAINEIVEDIKTIASAEQDQFQKSLEYELNDENTNDMDDDNTKNNNNNNKNPDFDTKKDKNVTKNHNKNTKNNKKNNEDDING